MNISSDKHEKDLKVLLLKVISQAMEDYSGLLPIRYRPKRALGRALYEAHLVFSSAEFCFKYFLDDLENPMKIGEALKRVSSSARADLGILRKHLKKQVQEVIEREITDMLKVPDVVVINGSPYQVIISVSERFKIDYDRHIIILNDSDKKIERAMYAFVTIMLEESGITATVDSVKQFSRLLSEFLAINGNIFFSRDVTKCRPTANERMESVE